MALSAPPRSRTTPSRTSIRTTDCPTAGSASTLGRPRGGVRGRDRRARTIFWNRPMGVFEWGALRSETDGGRGGRRGDRDAFSVVGGADSAAALNELGLADRDLVGLDRRRRPASSCSRARSCRGGGDSVGRRVACMIVAGNWKMYTGPDPRALAEQAGRRHRRGRDRLPAVHRAGRVRRGGADDVRAERPLGGRGRVHRRDLAGDVGTIGVTGASSAQLGAATVFSARPTRASRAARRPLSMRGSASSPRSGNAGGA